MKNSIETNRIMDFIQQLCIIFWFSCTEKINYPVILKFSYSKPDNREIFWTKTNKMLLKNLLEIFR